MLKPFANTFRKLENDGLLDRLNEVDMICLHYCFLPRIQKCLQSFREAWNHHVLSTEANATPYQLYLAGLIAVDRVPQAPISLPTLPSQQITSSGEQVQIPRSRFYPCSTLLLALRTNFDPLFTPNFFDELLYRNVINYVGQHLLSSCTSCTEL